MAASRCRSIEAVGLWSGSAHGGLRRRTLPRTVVVLSRAPTAHSDAYVVGTVNGTHLALVKQVVTSDAMWR
jgi:hypothetical protein